MAAGEFETCDISRARTVFGRNAYGEVVELSGRQVLQYYEMSREERKQENRKKYLQQQAVILLSQKGNLCAIAEPRLAPRTVLFSKLQWPQRLIFRKAYGEIVEVNGRHDLQYYKTAEKIGKKKTGGSPHSEEQLCVPNTTGLQIVA